MGCKHLKYIYIIGEREREREREIFYYYYFIGLYVKIKSGMLDVLLNRLVK